MEEPARRLRSARGVEGIVRVVPRSYRDILIEEIVQGLGELRRPAGGLLLSGFSAGLDVGFGVLLIGAAITLAGETVSPVGQRLLTANFYSLGFVFVVLGRSELFTEHTTVAVFPVLSRNASFGAPPGNRETADRPSRLGDLTERDPRGLADGALVVAGVGGARGDQSDFVRLARHRVDRVLAPAPLDLGYG